MLHCTINNTKRKRKECSFSFVLLEYEEGPDAFNYCSHNLFYIIINTKMCVYNLD